MCSQFSELTGCIVAGTCDALSPLEDVIRNEFIPALTGRSAITDQEHELPSLPCWLGSMGILGFIKLQYDPPTISSVPGHL